MFGTYGHVSLINVSSFILFFILIFFFLFAFIISIYSYYYYYYSFILFLYQYQYHNLLSIYQFSNCHCCELCILRIHMDSLCHICFGSIWNAIAANTANAVFHMPCLTVIREIINYVYKFIWINFLFSLLLFAFKL